MAYFVLCVNQVLVRRLRQFLSAARYLSQLDLAKWSERSMERLSTTQPAWYLLQCKARQDSRAEDNLLRQNYVTFRPQLVTQRLLRGKPQSVLESLFPGYLFIQLSHEDNWSALRSTRGVSRIVNFNHGPATVTDQVIAHLRARCSNELPS